MKKRFIGIMTLMFLSALLCLGACGPSETPPEEPPRETVEGRDVLTSAEVNSYDASYIKLFGRTYKEGKRLTLDHAGTGFEVTFYGTSLSANLSSAAALYCRTFLDGDTEGTRIQVNTTGNYDLAKDLENGFHILRMVKSNSTHNGKITVTNIATDGKFIRPAEEEHLSIEFIGDSVTVGAGVFGKGGDNCKIENTDATKGYAYLTAQALDADCSLVATEGIDTKKQNNPYLPITMLKLYPLVSFNMQKEYTFPTGGSDVVVVAMGTNDCVISGYTGAEFSADYKELLELVRSKNPNAKIVCIYELMRTVPAFTQGIQNAIAAMNDENISYFGMPQRTNGAEAHPSAADAVEQSAALTEYLKTLLG